MRDGRGQGRLPAAARRRRARRGRGPAPALGPARRRSRSSAASPTATAADRGGGQGRRRRPRRDPRRPPHRARRAARRARDRAARRRRRRHGDQAGARPRGRRPRHQRRPARADRRRRAPRSFDLDEVGVVVEVSVPGGEKMARRTSNPRLGIVGGISILGTTGIVRPFSTAAWRASVGQAIDVMDAQGERTVVLTTGGRSERAARRLPPELPEVCFVEVGDFTGYALKRAVAARVRALPVRRHGRQALQARRGRPDDPLDPLEGRPAVPGRRWPPRRAAATRSSAAVSEANSARHAYELWQAAGSTGRPTCCARRSATNLAHLHRRRGSPSTRSWSTSRARTWSAPAPARATRVAAEALP